MPPSKVVGGGTIPFFPNVGPRNAGDLMSDGFLSNTNVPLDLPHNLGEDLPQLRAMGPPA